MLLVLACLVIQAISATAFANAAPTKHARSTTRGQLATAARILPPALEATAKRSRQADRALVARAKGVKRCLRANVQHPGRCKSARRALQRAGARFARIERNLARLASSRGKSANALNARSASLAPSQAAPVLTLSGLKLSWNKVNNINTYVFVIKIPGQADRYGIITGTSATPPAVPGFTVKYSVRTSANGSAWATEKSITYPAAKAPEEVKTPPVKTEETKPPEEVKVPVKVNTQAAPELLVSGQKLAWNAVAGVSTYVLATMLPGSATTYSEVSGISFSPAGAAGTTVKYSLRTAVEGSLWSPEVSIAYPATVPVTPPVETPPTEPPPASSSMFVGVDAGGWGGSAVAADLRGAVNFVRLENPSNISVWTAAGIKIDADISGPYTTGGVKALNVASYVANAVAKVKANPGIVSVEVLNEASGSWFWGPNAASPQEAVAYDKLLEAVHNAFVQEFGSARPLILASYGGPSEAPVWGERLWAANPKIGNFCDGVVVHPYPSSGRGEADRRQVEEAHAKSGKPVWASEVGWKTSVVSEAEQAQDITNFLNWSKSTGYVAEVTMFNYRDYQPNETWGIETASGTHKLSYAALAKFLP